MSTQMTINISTAQGRVLVTIFHIKGQIDISTYEEFQKHAEQAFKSGVRNLLLDFSEVSYVASAGWRSLHYIYKLFRSESADESDEAVQKGLRDGTYKALHLKILNPKPEVFDVLKMTGFDMYIDVFYDLKEAVDAF